MSVIHILKGTKVQQEILEIRNTFMVYSKSFYQIVYVFALTFLTKSSVQEAFEID